MCVVAGFLFVHGKKCARRPNWVALSRSLMSDSVYSHPVHPPNLIRRINDNRPSLRKSEAKVADFVLSNTTKSSPCVLLIWLLGPWSASSPSSVSAVRSDSMASSHSLSLARQLGSGSVYSVRSR